MADGVITVTNPNDSVQRDLQLIEQTEAAAGQNSEVAIAVALVEDAAGLATSAKQTTLNNLVATAAIQVDGTQQAKVKETAPTDATKNNPALTLTYTGDNLTTISKVIGGTTYNKVLAYTGSVLDSVSAWVAA